MSFCSKPFFLIYFLGFFILQTIGYSQEIKASADVFLEEYSDEFQEKFFEALKQKGIENYDKAVNLLLECKKLKPNTVAVTNELAKAYLADKKYNLAQIQAEEAVKTEPTNMWYLQTLLLTIKKQGKNVNTIKEIIPYSKLQLKKNLAQVFYLEREYDAAFTVLEELKASTFKNNLSNKVTTAIARRSKRKTTTSFVVATNTASKSSSTVSNYKTRLKFIISQKNNAILFITAKKAVESYPSQPYFHYALGVAHNNKKKYRDAIKSLETALDYLLNDIRLEDNIYKELSAAYTALGHTAKANMYLLKIKFKS